MSSELEKYLKSQRESLDIETPDDQLIWEGIRQELQVTDSRRARKQILIRIRNIAASVIILLSMGYIAGDIIGDRHNGGELTLADIDPQLASREKAYRMQVNFKKQEALSIDHVDNVIIAELLEEIQKLDTIYEQTMNDLNELGDNAQAIQTIFDTYEKKIYLLELIILENNKIKNHETEANLFL